MRRVSFPRAGCGKSASPVREQETEPSQTGLSHLRVQTIEILGHSGQDRVHQIPHPAQRMINRNPIFQRHITEHPRLQLLIVSSHPCFLSHLACEIAVVFQQPPRSDPLNPRNTYLAVHPDESVRHIVYRWSEFHYRISVCGTVHLQYSHIPRNGNVPPVAG